MIEFGEGISVQSFYGGSSVLYMCLTCGAIVFETNGKVIHRRWHENPDRLCKHGNKADRSGWRFCCDYNP